MTKTNHALDTLSRLREPMPDGLVLQLKTLTPLYTGGIGQLGDQIHPSNLLGGIRHLSCLVARTLGDEQFEPSVWGNPGHGALQAQAKQIGLHWNTKGLLPKDLPREISFQRSGAKLSRWWFSAAYEGELSLQITRCGISQPHWHILMISLAIQLRHGSFGSKDQFGLGVLAQTDSGVLCGPLDTTYEWPKAVPAVPGKLNLLRYAFGGLQFRPIVGKKPVLNTGFGLKMALATRVTLRNALRAKPEATESEKSRLTQLRHRMLGSLNEAGSAVNVSAAYAVDGTPNLRIAIALKPETPEERTEVMKAFSTTFKTFSEIDNMIETTGYRVDTASKWEFGGSQTNNRAAWLNKLAGVGQ
jgi:hypothetical protein